MTSATLDEVSSETTKVSACTQVQTPSAFMLMETAELVHTVGLSSIIKLNLKIL